MRGKSSEHAPCAKSNIYRKIGINDTAIVRHVAENFGEYSTMTTETKPIEYTMYGRVLGFDISLEDKKLFPELKKRRTVKLVEDDNGFVHEV